MWARGPLRGRAGLTCTERSFHQEHRVSTEGSFQTGAAQAEPGSDVAEAGERQPPVLGVGPLVEEAIRLTNCSRAALGSQAQAGGAHGGRQAPPRGGAREAPALPPACGP